MDEAAEANIRLMLGVHIGERLSSQESRRVIWIATTSGTWTGVLLRPSFDGKQ